MTNNRIFIRYTGTSMWPALIEPDLLEVEPYGKKPIRRGDVVFCLPPGETGCVVHRVIQITKEGIRTKGDSNRQEDSGYLRTENILGQVVFANRGGNRRKIRGGITGEIVARMGSCHHPIARLLGPPYRYLARKGTIRRILGFTPRIVFMESKPHRFAYLLWGKRVIGRLDPKTGTWRIDKPFHLLIDEKIPIHKSQITNKSQ